MRMKVTLPDKSIRELPVGSSGYDLAKDIGEGLAKAAIAISVDGKQQDLNDVIHEDCSVSVITIESKDGLEIMRHTLAAQVLARALKNLYPDSKLAIGPTIDNGFYYDVECSKTISIDDLEKIEKEMHNIVKSKSSITKKLLSKSDALNVFKSLGESYKQEIINDSEQENDFQLYYQDNDKFVDLCRGPHLPNLSFIGAFKLTKVSGAYWKGDSNNKMLTRIYGTAWNTEKELNKHLHELEEAEKRDHRKIGKEMDLFHFQDEAPGMVFWHSDGWTIYRNLRNFVRSRLQESGYIEVNTPQVIDRKLWEASGHWDKYRENMFITEIDEEHANEKRVNALKPMNCPGHVQIYKQGLKSYRDLPIRMAEFGSCHRNEPSGALHGIMRVRAFTQDDAHIFCSEDQITSESITFCDLLRKIYKDFGFEDVRVKFSDRPAVRAGDDETWDRAEEALKSACEAAGLETTLNPGEGAFYGPKLEFVLRDAIGRDWQCGTLQVDFVLPERLDANYIASDGSKKRPVMLHRAILGSMERWIGILIEQYAGRFPIWLAPVQAVITTITSDNDDYACKVLEECKKVGLRAATDTRNEKINYKIREHSNAKIPVILVVGTKEQENETVAMRRLGGKSQEILALDDAVNTLLKESTPPR